MRRWSVFHVLRAFVTIFGLFLEEFGLLFQLLNHIIFYHDLSLKLLDLGAIVSLSLLTIG